MIAEIFVLTLFLCPSNVKSCTHAEYKPTKTQFYESFNDCEAVGVTLVDLGHFDDYSCHRHEEASWQPVWLLIDKDGSVTPFVTKEACERAKKPGQRCKKDAPKGLG